MDQVQMTDAAVQVAIAGAIVWLMEQLKRMTGVTFMTPDTAVMNRVVSMLFAGAAAIGITATFDQQAGVLTITGLTASGVAAGFWAWFKAYVFQELIYQGAIRPNQDNAALKAQILRLQGLLEQQKGNGGTEQ